jgi:MFS family permease
LPYPLLKSLSSFPSCLPEHFSVRPFHYSVLLSSISSSGALFGAPVADIIGRKWGIISACVIFSIGVAMQTASTALPLFVAGRVFAGLGVGLVSVLIPMYQSEWSVTSTT